MRWVPANSRLRTLLAGLCVVAVAACTPRQEAGTPPGLDGNEMYGQADMEWVLENISIFGTRTDLIRPDRASVTFLHDLRESITVTVFMGSWDVNAQIHVPELFAALREAENRRITVRIIGLDRRLRDRDGLAMNYGITASPTFVIEHRGIEIGRVIETPTRDAASDIMAIVQNALGG